MDRRIFLKSSAAIPLAAALPRAAFAQQTTFNPQPGSWRTHEIATRVEVLKPAGVSRVWLPVPSVEDGSQKPLDNSWAGNAKVTRIAADGKYGAGIFYAEWPEGEAKPVVELTSRFMSRDRAADLSKPNPALRLDAQDARVLHRPHRAAADRRHRARRPRSRSPAGTRTDMQKAKAIYDWIVDNTLPRPEDARLRRRRHQGDARDRQPRRQVRRPQRALRRARPRRSGLPARDVYGIRVAKCAVRLPQPRRRNGERHERAALPRRGVPRPATAGCRSIRPTCARSCSRRRPKPTTLADPLVQPVRQSCSARGR